MARFDAYAQPGEPGYLLDVQAGFLSPLSTRVVVPLLPLDFSPKAADRLNPCFEIQGVTVSMVTQFMAAIPAAELKHHVASLDRHSAAILDAIDFLHQGW